MSFILDAIKKSEDERQRGKGPDVYSLQGSGMRAKNTQPMWLRLLQLVLALALLLGMAKFLWPQLEQQFVKAQSEAAKGASVAHNDRGQSAQDQNIQTNTSSNEQNQFNQSQNRGESAGADNFSNSNAQSNAQNNTQSSTLNNTQSNAPATSDQFSNQDRRYASDDDLPPRHLIKELWELPADYQASVPDLKFSFHVYSPNVDKRTIIINGRRLREGQMITSQMRLRLITDTGVVCHHRGRFFHVDVVEKW